MPNTFQDVRTDEIVVKISSRMDTQQKGCKVEIDTNDEKVTVLQK